MGLRDGDGRDEIRPQDEAQRARQERIERKEARGLLDVVPVLGDAEKPARVPARERGGEHDQLVSWRQVSDGILDLVG